MGVKNILTQGGDGTAIPSGMVGHIKTATNTLANNPSTTIGTWSDISSLSLELYPGVWNIEIHIGTALLGWSSGASSFGAGMVGLRTAANQVIKQQAFLSAGDFGANAYASSTDVSGVTLSLTINVTAATTYKASVTTIAWSGSPVFGAFSVRGDIVPSTITATHIAG